MAERRGIPDAVVDHIRHPIIERRGWRRLPRMQTRPGGGFGPLGEEGASVPAGKCRGSGRGHARRPAERPGP